MNVHWVAKTSGIKAVKTEFPLHVSEKAILDCKKKMPVYFLKSLNFVMKLHQNGFCRHFPIHTEGFFGRGIFFCNSNPFLFQKSLPFRPYCSSSIKCLEFHSNKIHYPFVPNRNKKIVNRTAWNRNFRNNMYLVTRFMICKKVHCIKKYLVCFQKTIRTNDDHSVILAISDGTSSD